MEIAIVTVFIAVLFFFYTPHALWIRASMRYLVGLFCFWTACVLLRADLNPEIIRWSGIGLVFLCAAFLSLDLLMLGFSSIKQKISEWFRRAPQREPYLAEIWAAIEKMAIRKIGALIVLQRKDPLKPFLKGGIPFDADIKSEIIFSLFITTSAVHDGALVIYKERIKTVKGILPLAALSDASPNFGTRHRAAIGITEKTDALALVVSEERGEISIAHQGCLIRIPSGEEFFRILTWILKGKNIFRLKNVHFSVMSKILENLA